jgi:hypothetical protein
LEAPGRVGQRALDGVRAGPGGHETLKVETRKPRGGLGWEWHPASAVSVCVSLFSHHFHKSQQISPRVLVPMGRISLLLLKCNFLKLTFKSPWPGLVQNYFTE